MTASSPAMFAESTTTVMVLVMQAQDVARLSRLDAAFGALSARDRQTLSTTALSGALGGSGVIKGATRLPRTPAMHEPQQHQRARGIAARPMAQLELYSLQPPKRSAVTSYRSHPTGTLCQQQQ